MAQGGEPNGSESHETGFGAKRSAGLAPRTEKVSEVIARQIVKDIVNRGMTPGTMLPPETQMLERFKVGRASLREALRILEVNGLIVIKSGPGGGPIVSEPDSVDFGRMAALYFEMSGATMRELVDARLIIEPIMARRAAIRQDATVVGELNGLVTDAAAIDSSNAESYGRVSSDFHSAITGASGNRILDLFGRAIKEVFMERINGMVFPAKDRDRIRDDHQAVIDAIADGDADLAENLMHAHMEEFAEQMAKRYPGLMDEVVAWR
jgi:GntR family transcriptional regulator, transcriptional repressor for pyruvate dehydrogenase complex